MASPARPRVLLRFGPFELNAASGELRKAGLPLKIHPQPIRVLQLLAERSGQIVTREEIQRCLWGDNTYVDFEAGINFCIKQVRDTLADDAERPRYIETIPRQGYRFIAAVTHGHPREQVLSFPHAPAEPTQAPAMPREPSSPLRTARPVLAPAARSKPLSRFVLPSVLAIFAFAAILIAVFYFRRPPKLTEKDTIVLADFRNNTGDPVFDEALKQALAMELEQSPFLNVLSQTKAGETLALMGRSPNDRLTPEVSRDLCLRSGSKAFLGGAISSLGTHYLVEVDAVACKTGDTLAKAQFEAASKDDVLKALSRASSNLRAKLGESLPSVEKFDVPIQVTTSSLAALKYYAMAGQIVSEKGDAPAIPFLNRAIELDPNFAMAYAALAFRYNNMDEPSQALAYATKAYELRDRVTEREKLRISVAYFRMTGALDQQAQIFDLWTADYPRDLSPHGYMGVNFLYAGQYEKALAEFQKISSFGPDSSVDENLADANIALGRFDDAGSALQDAQEHKLESADLHRLGYYLAFLRRDFPQMEQQAAQVTGKLGSEDEMLAAEADTEAYFGRLRRARDFSRQAIDSAVRADSNERAGLWQAMLALRDAELGSAAEVPDDVRQALALSSGRNVRLLGALALARAGNSAQAQTLAFSLEKDYPSSTLLKLYRLPAIHAAIALNANRPAQALAFLEPGEPYDLGQPSPLPLATMYLPYLRGLAYLQLHNGPAAAAQFQKLLDHPGISLNFPPAVMSRLQIARAEAMAGDNSKAQSAYQNFLSVWQDADPNIRIRQQAQQESAKLH